MGKRILILSVEAGYGHRKVAEAIRDEIKSRQKGIDIQVQDALDKSSWWFQNFYAQTYFTAVMWVPWLWGFAFGLTDVRLLRPLMQPLRTAWNRLNSRALRQYLAQEQFDVILFTHFFPAEVCATMKNRKEISATLITVVTDVVPHGVWQNEGTDHYWVMAEWSREVLIKRGAGNADIRTGGIPISPVFLKPVDKNELQTRFGLKRDLFTILLTSGSFGSGPTEEVLDSLEHLQSRIQVIVVCGKNEKLFQTLERRQFPFLFVLFGLVNNMPEIMSVSNLLIAKPGGATMCESLAKGLPMVILGAIPGQESHNAEWLLGAQAAFQAKNPKEVASIVSEIVSNPQVLEDARQGIKHIARPKAASDLADFVEEKLGKTS